MHRPVLHFVFAACALLLFCVPLRAEAQGELEVQAGGQKYSLPEVGGEVDPKEASLPIDPATMATLEAWRGFAWSADKKKYLYRFGAAARTSAVIVLTADSSAGELAVDLDRAAELLSGIVGTERLPKTSVAIVCGTQDEYERAVDHAVATALAMTEDPIQRAYLEGAWRTSAKKSPTFILPLAGIVGCVEGNSEKWSPQHEVIRGFAEATVTGFAPYLANLLPLQAGLAWNVEFDLTGEILSMPNSDEFQFDIGRGSWSASKIASALKKIEKGIKKEEKRELALKDLPYLARGATSTADSAAIGWALARHLIRHHGAGLPAALVALSEEVVAQNTVVRGDGSTSYDLQPGYSLAWAEVDRVLTESLVGYRFEDAATCMSSSCATCKAWAKGNGIR